MNRRDKEIIVTMPLLPAQSQNFLYSHVAQKRQVAGKEIMVLYE